MNEWQPIETAPRDGTRILTADTNSNIVIRSWASNGFAGWSDNGDRGVRSINVTQWMPLPDPPKVEVR